MSNQVVIVTGAAQGIGQGVATCFARKGATVVVADLDQTRAEAAAAGLRGEGAADAMGIRCGVTLRDSGGTGGGPARARSVPCFSPCSVGRFVLLSPAFRGKPSPEDVQPCFDGSFLACSAC